MSGDIRDIKGLAALYTWYRPGLWLGIAILLAVAATWWYRRRRQPPSAVIPPEPAKAPAALALEALENLRERMAEANPKPFHFGLSEILRIYVEGRFGFPATDRTSEEIRALLGGTVFLSENERDHLLSLLALTDRVKFTDFAPSLEQSRQAWDRARQFVLATREVAG